MINKLSLQIFSTALVGFTALLLMPSLTHAASCTFDRNLDVGSIGADVQCLQQFLNASGFPVATSGLGSTGLETTKFAGGTKAAVVNWQRAQGVSPASGYWGPATRAAYDRIQSGSTTVTPTTPTVTTTAPSTGLSALLRLALKGAVTEVENTTNMINDAKSDNLKTSTAEELQNNAQSNLFDAIFAFLDNKTSQAITSANVALEKTKLKTSSMKLKKHMMIKNTH